MQQNLILWLFLTKYLSYVSGSGPESESVQLSLFSNSALYPPSFSTSWLSELQYTIPSSVSWSSLSIKGLLLLPQNIDMYYFQCLWSEGMFGFLYLNDHLICTTNVYENTPFTQWNISYVEEETKSRTVILRSEIYVNGSNTTRESGYSFDIQWSFSNNDTFRTINGTYLRFDENNTNYQYLTQREQLQLQHYNNTWKDWLATNFLIAARMPDSFGVFGKKGIDRFVFETNNNHSYWSFELTEKNATVLYEFAVAKNNDPMIKSELYVRLTLINIDTNVMKVGTVVSSRFLWSRVGDVWSDCVSQQKQGEMYCLFENRMIGMAMTFSLFSGNKPSVRYCNTTNANCTQYFSFAFPGVNTSVLFTTNESISSNDEIAMFVDEFREKQYQHIASFGNFTDLYNGIETVMMYNWIYSPSESTFGIISRSWGWLNGNDYDFKYVIFDWDNIFGSYLYALFASDSNNDYMFYSVLNIITVIKTKTVYGFVPNFKWIVPRDDFGPNTLCYSNDRTEPPIGAMVVWKLYEQFGGLIYVLYLSQSLSQDLFAHFNA
ncbi:hypothetical protein RFI_25003 [Reticulomyxa filosa]|uniref:Uncharacterized protein n=1 Tax=Reticulomyxa filosa TaxID=46433 RepID=X6MG54_RETFI|nr:hypothetical protein RFI_25003 [Reticulomyxa filosa]|eukprot:ETO12372.1 hypothetical protein RFI_25003 [Reticulomyxa filosa]